MIVAPRRSPSRRRDVPPGAALTVLALAAACPATPALAADPAAADAGPDAAEAERTASTGETDPGDGMNHGDMDHGGMDRGGTELEAMDHGSASDVREMVHGDVTGTDHDARADAGAPAALVGTSADGLYRVELRNLPEPVPLNRMHEWIVHVEAADGTPVTGASIAMDGGMPIHDHGLPTAPRVTAELGNGDYRLEGVRFQMPGHWVVELAIDAAPGTDSVAFDLNL